MEGAAFFDLDKTVIAKASMAAFGRPLYRRGLISRTTVLRVLYAQLVYMQLGASEQKLARIRDSVLTLTRGWDQTEIREIVRETLEEIVEPIIYAEAVELMNQHREAGRKVFIISASPEEVAQPLGEYLGADEVIASRARVDESGRYTGHMDFYAYGAYKAEAMRARAAADGIDLSASYAYSDSYTDCPMLEAVGHPVAVNADRVLRRLARERGWETMTFRRTVPLRRRARLARPRLAAAVALTAGAVIGGAVVYATAQRGRSGPATLGRRRPAGSGLGARAVSRRGASWPRRRRGR